MTFMRLIVLFLLLIGGAALHGRPVVAQTVDPTPAAAFSVSQSGSTVSATSVGSSSTPLPASLVMTNSSTTQGTLNVTINAGSPAASVLGSGYIYSITGNGFEDSTNDSVPGSYVIGTIINVANAATLALTGPPIASNPTYPATGAIIAYSAGAHGYDQTAGTSQSAIYNGGAGGPVTVTHAGSIAVGGMAGASEGAPWLPYVTGIGASSFGGYGIGQKNNDTDFAGNGGDGGALNIATNAGSQIILQGRGSASTPINGITAYSQGAQPGCDCSGDHANLFGASGAGGTVTVNHAGSIISTASDSIGIVAVSIGGTGGLLPGSGVGNSGGGISGPGGAVFVKVENGGSINLAAGSGIGIFAASAVGEANNNYATTNGISGGPVTVIIDPGGSVISTGLRNFNVGVLAISTGTSSILEPFGSNSVTIGGGGYSGSVTVSNGGSISTTGQMAIGIAALSVGGAGIVTNAAPTGLNYIGSNASSNSSASGGAVSVTNAGLIITDGASAFGIAATSAGAGGLAGLASNATVSDGSWAGGLIVGGMASSSNPGGAVTVLNAGAITTGDGQGGGKAAIGIIAQSIGGSGGNSGGSGAAAFVGDAGGGGGNGGNVTVSNSGTILTQDDGAIGILAQSVGGGGGNGANAAGVFVATGGEGGNGGVGGQVTVTLSNSARTLQTQTEGDFAAGVIAQSIGGGGGNGGYGTSGGVFVSTAIGGTAGSGGDGGAVTLNNSQTISTTGQNSVGVIAQSVGGGGGNGGAATSYAAGLPFVTNIAIGGSGGSGGSGSTVTINNNYHIFTAGADAVGVIAQSIGGGGGTGGASTAKTLGVSVPGIPSFAFTAALGGSGGQGGNGGNVAVNNAGEITTQSAGAHGLLAQSIGGGGGNGGDSTAASQALAVGASSVQLAIALGATGGSGGSGGAVSVINGPSSSCTGCNSQTYTVGQGAAGIVAQSIGAGGGNSTAGNASNAAPNLGSAGGDTYEMSIGLGASGGTGGAGGTVSVTLNAGSLISTTGSGSPGIIAQSIGGGGGSSSGGSFGLSVSNVQLAVSAGGTGVPGSSGGTVTVNSGGTISTAAGDSIGILAQSIGGGGGWAGSTDASASVSASNQAENVINVPSGNTYEANVAIGGKGGGGGNGNTVTVANTGSIATLGERAYGIEAQSVGGGGGNGGTATSTSNGTTNGTYSASVTLGGGGGAAGSGGLVTVTSAGPIATAGYNAYGILAQSIGGGGGVGGDGSVSATTTIGLGAGVNGNGGASGTASNVSVTTQTGGTITTLGDDASGVLAQSIGGGGGVATAGCTNSGSASIGNATATACFGNTGISAGTNGPAAFSPGAQFTLNVGGGASAAGNGDNVGVTVADAIVTTGARSMGVTAQSIGGGGGYAAGAAQTLSGTGLANSPGTSASTGGPVTVNLNSSGSITTYGAGAWGILAQSIGGSGGFSGDPSLALAVPVSNTLPQSGNGNAFANTVSVNINGNITTSGANAHGVFAQSIGGGGGIVAGCCQLTTAVALAGNTAQFRGITNSIWGSGGTIDITQGAGSTIVTSGSGSIGIVGQSSGTAALVNPMTVTIGGTVIGGTNGGTPVPAGTVGAAGVLLSGGGNSVANPNIIAVSAGGSISTVDGIGGTAIIANSGVTNVANAGTITGSINLGSTPGTINNTGVLNAGATLVASTLTNAGTLAVSGTGVIGTTNLTGTLAQTGSGTFAIDVNSSAAQKVDLLTVSGSAQIAGLVVPTVATSLLPGAMTIVTASNLSATATATSSLLFNWTLLPTSTSLSLSPSSNFMPQGVTLNQSGASLAGYLTQAWNASDSQFAPLFAYLSQITNGSAYATTLNAYSPQATQAQATALINAEGALLGAPMSCPVFIDQGTLLGEDNCIWAKFTGGQTSQYVTTDTPGYQVAGTTYRIGAQHEIAPDWYFGGSIAAGLTWATENGGSSGHGQVFDGGVALKHTAGPWLFAGSIVLATGAYHNNRLISLPSIGTAPGVNALLQSDSNVFLTGGRLRAAYDFAFGDWYIRPYGDLDVVYSNVPGFQESGQRGYALNVLGGSRTSVVLSPMVEIGGRYNIDASTIMRPYAAVGMSATPNNTRTISATFVGAQPGDGTFQAFIKSPNLLGKFAVGLQLYRVGGFEVKAEYSLDAGSAYLAQSGSARVAYHF